MAKSVAISKNKPEGVVWSLGPLRRQRPSLVNCDYRIPSFRKLRQRKGAGSCLTHGGIGRLGSCRPETTRTHFFPSLFFSFERFSLKNDGWTLKEANLQTQKAISYLLQTSGTMKAFYDGSSPKEESKRNRHISGICKPTEVLRFQNPIFFFKTPPDWRKQDLCWTYGDYHHRNADDAKRRNHWKFRIMPTPKDEDAFSCLFFPFLLCFFLFARFTL